MPYFGGVWFPETEDDRPGPTQRGGRAASSTRQPTPPSSSYQSHYANPPSYRRYAADADDDFIGPPTPPAPRVKTFADFLREERETPQRPRYPVVRPAETEYEAMPPLVASAPTLANTGRGIVTAARSAWDWLTERNERLVREQEERNRQEQEQSRGVVGPQVPEQFSYEGTYGTEALPYQPRAPFAQQIREHVQANLTPPQLDPNQPLLSQVPAQMMQSFADSSAMPPSLLNMAAWPQTGERPTTFQGEWEQAKQLGALGVPMWFLNRAFEEAPVGEKTFASLYRMKDADTKDPAVKAIIEEDAKLAEQISKVQVGSPEWSTLVNKRRDLARKAQFGRVSYALAQPGGLFNPPESVSVKYREEAPLPLQIAAGIYFDPTGFLDLGLTGLAKGTRIAKQTLRERPIADSVTKVAADMTKTGQRANSFLGKWSPFRLTNDSLRNALVNETFNNMGRILEAAGDDPSLMIKFIQNPDAEDVVKATSGFSASRPAKRTAALMQRAWGENPEDELRKMYETAKGDSITMQADLARKYDEAATSFFPQTDKSLARAAKDSVNNALSVAYMGYSLAYALSNGMNNRFTGIFDGHNIFQGMQDRQRLITDWGPLPLEAKKGIGPAGDVWKKRTEALAQVESLNKAMSDRELFTGLSVRRQGGEKLPGILKNTTLKLGQNDEAMMSEKIVVSALQEYWPEVWNKTTRNLRIAMRDAGLPEDVVEHLSRELATAKNPKQVSAIIAKYVDGIADAGATLAPELAEDIRKAAGGAATDEITHIVSEIPTKEGRDAAVGILEKTTEARGVADSGIVELRAAVEETLHPERPKSKEDFMHIFDMEWELVERVKKNDAALIQSVWDAEGTIPDEVYGELWTRTREVRKNNRLKLQNELNNVEEALKDWGFKPEFLASRREWRKYQFEQWAKSDALIEGFWEQKRRGDFRGNRAKQNAAWQKQEAARNRIAEDLRERGKLIRVERDAAIEAAKWKWSKPPRGGDDAGGGVAAAPEPVAPAPKPSDGAPSAASSPAAPVAAEPVTPVTPAAAPSPAPAKPAAPTVAPEIIEAANKAGIPTAMKNGVPMDKVLLAFARKHVDAGIDDVRNLTPEQTVKLFDALEQRAAERAAATKVVDDAAKTPTAGTKGSIKTAEVNLDPARFQYKLDVDPTTGVSTNLKKVKTWNPAFGKGISVWVDPADGKTYVINGHHRVELAKRLGVDKIDAPYYIEAKDAAEARLIGAMQNIAEGRGTAVDAGKVFRELGVDRDVLDKWGLALSESKVSQGMALAGLNDALFMQVVNKQLPLDVAVVIGERLPGQADMQMQLARVIEQQAEKGERVTVGVVAEMADAMASGPIETFTQATLFGEEETVSSLFLERAKLLDYARGRIAKEKSVFGGATRNAKELERVGSIDVEAAKEIKSAAERNLELFDITKNQRGPVSDLTNEYAKAVARGDKNAKEEYYRLLVDDALPRALRGESSSAVTPAPRDVDTGVGGRDIAELGETRPRPTEGQGGFNFDAEEEVAAPPAPTGPSLLDAADDAAPSTPPAAADALLPELREGAAPPPASRFAGKSREELELQRQMYLDNMKLKREQRQAIPDAWRAGLAEIEQLLAGETPQTGRVAGLQVFGHPQATNIGGGKYDLIPIVTDSVERVDAKIKQAQALFDELATKAGQAEQVSKLPKTKLNAAQRKLLDYYKSAQYTEDVTVRDLLHSETMPELNRLRKALEAKPATKPVTPVTPDVAAKGTDAGGVRIYPGSRGLKIKNLDAMPRGTGAKYLEVVDGENGDLVAYAWRRSVPKDMPKGHSLIDMRPSKNDDTLSYTTPKPPDALGFMYSPDDPHVAAKVAAEHMRPLWRRIIGGTTSAPISKLTPEQATWLKQFETDVIRPKMIRDKSIVSNIAVTMRNFALGDYSRKRNIHEWLAFLYPYSYWYTFTYWNWAQRLATHPGVLAKYARLKAIQRDANREWYRDEIGDPTAELPEYYADQIRFPFGGDNAIVMDFERALNPLVALTDDFITRERSETPSFPMYADEVKQALADGTFDQLPAYKTGKLIQTLNNQGPSIFSPLIWAYSAWLASKGYKDAAQQWVGYLTPISRWLKSTTALYKETDLPGADIIPPGGFTPEQLVLNNVKGGDIWERRRIGRYLYPLESTSQGFSPQQIKAAEKAGYSHAGKTWEAAMQREAVERAPSNISAAIVRGGKLRTITDITIDQMNNERSKIFAQRDNMTKEQYSAAWDAFDKKYPWARVVSMAKATDPLERLTDYSWIVLKRIPPGTQQAEAFAETGIDAELASQLISKWYDTKYDLTKFTPEEQEEWRRVIERLGDKLDPPTPQELAKWEQAKAESKRITEATAKAAGMSVEDWQALQEQYFALPEDSAERRQFLKDHPELRKGWDASTKAKQQASDTYQKVYQPDKKTPEQAAKDTAGKRTVTVSPALQKAVDDNAKYEAEAGRKFGPDILDLNREYGGMSDAEKRAFKTQYPDEYARLKGFWDWRSKEWEPAHPEWKKEYRSGSTTTTSNTGTGKTTGNASYTGNRYSSYSGGSYGGTGRGGGYTSRYGSYGGGSAGTSQPLPPAPPPTLPATTGAAWEAWQPAEFDAYWQQLVAADPALPTRAGLQFGAQPFALLQQWLRMTPEQRKAWRAANPQAWQMIAAMMGWLTTQKAGSTDSARVLASIPTNVVPPPRESIPTNVVLPPAPPTM